jgi:hypothetical protein
MHALERFREIGRMQSVRRREKASIFGSSGMNVGAGTRSSSEAKRTASKCSAGCAAGIQSRAANIASCVGIFRDARTWVMQCQAGVFARARELKVVRAFSALRDEFILCTELEQRTLQLLLEIPYLCLGGELLLLLLKSADFSSLGRNEVFLSRIFLCLSGVSSLHLV